MTAAERGVAEKSDYDSAQPSPRLSDFQPQEPGAGQLDWALAYAAIGMRVFPVNAKKRPLTEHGVHDATTSPETIREWWKEWPYADPAWAVPATMVVVDLDVDKGDGFKDFLAHEGVEADAVETPQARTPTGGRHLVFQANGSTYKNGVRVNGSAIDLRTGGGYIVLPGGHNGRQWVKQLTTPLDHAPPWIPIAIQSIDRLRGEATAFSGVATPYAWGALASACRKIASAPCGEQESTLNNECFSIGTLIGAGEIGEEEAIARLIEAVHSMPAYREPWGDLSWKVRRSVSDGMRSPRPRPEERSSHPGNGDPEWDDDLHRHDNPNSKKGARRKRERAPRHRPPWMQNCIMDDKGRILPILANVLVALRAAPELVDVLAYDEMLRASVLAKPLPVAPNGESVCLTEPLPCRVRDADVSQLQEWLQHRGMRRVGKDQTHQAVDQRSHERAFHPVRDYLNGLQWDGVSRLDFWLVDYLGAEPGEYSSRIGAMFLISMVARIYQPGCKVDYMPVFEGEQGIEKSAACRVLAGKWFSDSLPDIHDKDASQHLNGKWLIEIAELAAIGRAESEALKAFITRQAEQYRRSYGRLEVTEPRQCVFIGTTNKPIYLKDETGARRFWPVKVGKVDLDGLKGARDQLFAEAVHRYRGGEKWWPDTEFERKYIKPQQEDRYESDPWEQAIRAYAEGLPRVQVTEVANAALGVEIGRIGTIEQRRISGVLVAMGWTPGRTKHGRFYSAPGRVTDDAR